MMTHKEIQDVIFDTTNVEHGNTIGIILTASPALVFACKTAKYTLHREFHGVRTLVAGIGWNTRAQVIEWLRSLRFDRVDATVWPNSSGVGYFVLVAKTGKKFVL